MKRIVITIDGPAGSGKSTAARMLAKRLGYLYLDTGAMYRAAALKAIRSKAALTDWKALEKLAARSRIELKPGPAGRLRVLLDGKEVTRAIRRPEVSLAASQVAVVPAVRRVMVHRQRAIGKGGGIVAEGRDTGTVVFPKADLKFFLTASLPERARRRWRELNAGGHRVSLSHVLREARRRDRRDRQRETSPLKAAPGAVRIDTTRLRPGQSFAKLLDYVRGAKSCACFD